MLNLKKEGRNTMSQQNEYKVDFLKEWNDYTYGNTLNEADSRRSFATRVDDYSRSKALFLLGKGEDLVENVATKVFERAADAVMTESEIQPEFVSSPKAQKAMERAMNAKIYDESESKMKKIFAATINAADKLGITQVAGLSVKDIADGADIAFSGMKTAFQVGNGMITGQQASEIATEHFAARVAKGVEMAIRGAGKAVNAWVAVHASPVVAAVTAPIVNAATKVAGSKVGKFVGKGVKKVVEFAKPHVQKVKEKVKEYGGRAVRAVSNAVKSAGRAIASFFGF